jgi:hypothetical protein
MRKMLCALVLGIALVLGTVAPSDAQGVNLHRDIVVDVGQVQDNVFILGGSATVDGRVKKSVVAIGGTVTISGTVEESVVGIGATITLKPSAVIKKDVVAFGGRLIREPGSSVGNDTVFFDLSSLVPRFMRHGGARGFFSLSIVPLLLIFKLITAFLWLLMALLVAGIFPRQTAVASTQVRRSFWPVFGTGILGFIIFIGLVIVSALLCLILIGIPILLFVLVAALALRVFGQVALFHFFGESVARSLGNKQPSVLGASLLGWVVVSLIGFIPVIGLLFSLVVSILAFGTSIMTKFGTTANWLARRQAQAAPPAPPSPPPSQS